MTEKEVNEKIVFKTNLINTLEKKIKKGRITSIIIHVLIFPIIIFGFRFFSEMISTESFFDFLKLNTVYNGFVVLTIIILIYSAINHSIKDKEYKKKLEREIKLLESKRLTL